MRNDDELQTLINNGDKIAAINWVKDNFKVSLKEADEFVESLIKNKKSEIKISQKKNKRTSIILTVVIFAFFSFMVIAGHIIFPEVVFQELLNDIFVNYYSVCLVLSSL